MKTRVAGLMLILLAVPAFARGDGLPVNGLDGRAGVVSPDGAYRLVTFTGARHTVVARLHTKGGDIARSRTIPGEYAVPAVAYDSSGSGLSQDGRTLVLIRPRTTIPQKSTSLAILDARRFVVTKTIKLRGDFSFDAVSPDGSRIYLVQYLSLSRHNFDPSRYAVRSLDVRSARLDRAPIVDPREPDEKMGGLPVTRAMSPDGRWAYTLYSGSEHPFIHALDTVGRTARCVDLDHLSNREDLFLMRLRLADGGRALDVVRKGKSVMRMDTATFAVSNPRPAAAARQPAPAPDRSEGPLLWPWVLAAAVLLALGGVAARPLARAGRSH
ncbi:MAG TPA: hypothetical protein VH247_03365 [Thermoleophilaceae bacterium]|nr:hypothetical protein [Thermoleophilaceae bacterium]